MAVPLDLSPVCPSSFPYLLVCDVTAVDEHLLLVPANDLMVFLQRRLQCDHCPRPTKDGSSVGGLGRGSLP